MPEETAPVAAPPAAPAANPQAAGLDAARVAIDTAAAKERLAAIPTKDPKVLDPVEPTGTEQVTELDISAEPVPEGEAAPAEPDTARRERFTKAAQDAKRNRLRKQREREEQQRIRLERDTYAQQAAHERAQREQAEAIARSVSEADPLEYLRARGIDPKTVVERALEDGTPEGQIKALRAELQAEREARIQRDQAEAQRRAREADERNARDFLDVAKRKDDFPTLARLAKARPESIVNEANLVAMRTYRQRGAYPSFDQICEYLEYEYSRALKDDERPKTEPSRSGAPSTQPVAPATDRQAGKSQTLTSRTAERATLPKPFGQMTKEEQGAYLLAQWKRETGAGG